MMITTHIIREEICVVYTMIIRRYSFLLLFIIDLVHDNDHNEEKNCNKIVAGKFNSEITSSCLRAPVSDTSTTTIIECRNMPAAAAAATLQTQVNHNYHNISGRKYPKFWTCIFKWHSFPSMWPASVEFRSVSSLDS